MQYVLCSMYKMISQDFFFPFTGISWGKEKSIKYSLRIACNFSAKRLSSQIIILLYNNYINQSNIFLISCKLFLITDLVKFALHKITIFYHILIIILLKLLILQITDCSQGNKIILHNIHFSEKIKTKKRNTLRS